MANTAYRKPIIGGDNNAWGPYNDAFVKMNVGSYQCYLYNDAGTLKLSKGMIGINNGTVYAIADIDTITTITLTGTAGIWQQIEMAVSGSAVTLTATDMAGETDPAVLPSNFTGGYDAEKMGYYITATKRCIGLVWVDSGGTLAGVVNVKSGILGYHGKTYLDIAQTAEMRWNKTIDVMVRDARYEIGDWDMTFGGGRSVNHLITNWTKMKKISALIRNDADISRYAFVGASADYLYCDNTNINAERTVGGNFDNANFNATSYNRGWFIIELEE